MPSPYHLPTPTPWDSRLIGWGIGNWEFIDGYSFETPQVIQMYTPLGPRHHILNWKAVRERNAGLRPRTYAGALVRIGTAEVVCLASTVLKQKASQPMKPLIHMPFQEAWHSTGFLELLWLVWLVFDSAVAGLLRPINTQPVVFLW